MYKNSNSKANYKYWVFLYFFFLLYLLWWSYLKKNNDIALNKENTKVKGFLLVLSDF